MTRYKFDIIVKRNQLDRLKQRIAVLEIPGLELIQDPELPNIWIATLEADDDFDPILDDVEATVDFFNNL